MTLAIAPLDYTHLQCARTRADDDGVADIDRLLQALRTLPPARLERELTWLLGSLVRHSRCLFIFEPMVRAGLDPFPAVLQGSLSRELMALYENLLREHDPLAEHARGESQPLAASISAHGDWLRSNVRNPHNYLVWLQRSGAQYLIVAPARGRLARATLYVFAEAPAASAAVLAVYYATQRLLALLEPHYFPFLDALLAIKLSAREKDILRAGAEGVPSSQIALRMGLSTDAIQYYFKNITAKVPSALQGVKPREIARLLCDVDRL